MSADLRSSAACNWYGAAATTAVAGFRISECLAWGRYLYIDDLVSASADRSKGYGGALFDWIAAFAEQDNCDQLHLDSGVQRFAAHRFYLQKRMSIECHHFGLKLRETQQSKGVFQHR